MNNFSKLLLAFLALSLTISSCKKDDEPETPVIPNEEEVITTLIYRLTPALGGDEITFSFVDIDGDGGQDPIYTEPTLMANTSYAASIELFNETEDPAENITLEIDEEDEEHQFFFSTDLSGTSVSYADFDNNGNPIGLSTVLETTDAGSGTLTITLRHEPNKEGTGVSDGDITNAGGETDIEVSFNVEVQ